MQPLPAAGLRTNLATWAVPGRSLPAVAGALLDSLPREAFDPDFRGQLLETSYFDTRTFDLRRARRKGDKYLTLRLRCYGGADGPAGPDADTYALSAKTEDRKWRLEVEPATAHLLLSGAAGPALALLLPGDLRARLLELAGEEDPCPVAQVCATRYAVEDAGDRLTLDVGARTDTGKALAFHVLEFKSTRPELLPPTAVAALGLRPIKLSKFLWATYP